MASRAVVSRVDRFAGLSDRAVPIQLSRIESPDLLNCDFSDRVLTVRRGYSRIAGEFVDSSLRLDGYDDYARITYDPAYASTTDWSICFHTRLRDFPESEVVAVSRGYGNGSNRFVRISYDPTVNGGLGGWRLWAWDALNSVLRDVTINDGDAELSQIGKTRVVSLTYDGLLPGIFTFTVKDFDGSNPVTVGVIIDSFVSTTLDWFIGCDTDAALLGDAAPVAGDPSYYPGLMSEFRVASTTDTATIALLSVAGRELRSNAFIDEAAGLLGYWKLNDGNGTTLADSSPTDNAGVVGSSGTSWVVDSSQINGSAGLQFNGERGHIQVNASDVATHTFTATATADRNWALSFLLVPKLGQGETTVRDQTLFWSGSDGTGSADPEPLGIQVISDNLVVKYRDATTLRTVTLGLALSSVADQKCRVIVLLNNLGGTSGIQAKLVHPGGSSLGSDLASGDPATISNNWSIGRRLDSFVIPQTFPPVTGSAGRSAFCILDDFALHKAYTTTVGAGIPSFPLFSSRPELLEQEYSSLTSVGVPDVAMVWSLPLNEGDGNVTSPQGSRSSSASIFPEQGEAFSWGRGLVLTDDPPPITMIRDYRRFLADGSFKRTILLISGTTLFEYDPVAAVATAVAGGLPKGGKWSHDQYSNEVYLACNNGHPPVVYDGVTVRQVGITAPNIASSSQTGVAGGSFVPGDVHHIYVTYRNASTGVESNPGPEEALTIGVGDDAITQVDLPISSDPQVNQRRIWITAANGGAGSTAFLSATVDDNVTTSYTTAILAPGLAPALTPGSGYLDNAEAPQGGIIRVFKDRLWVGGNAEFPTKVFYSKPGQLTSFYPAVQFEDVDADSGDPVIGLKELRDQLIAYLRDGRVAISPTGDVVAPFALYRLNQDVGAVNHHSILVYENRHLFLGERDIWIWSGEDATNLSSPQDNDRPSVKNYIREDINDARKFDASVAIGRSKDQVWFAVATGSSTRNNEALILDISQGVWSRYEMDIDYVAEIEDDNDEPTLYAGIRGYLCKLDTGKGDGLTVPAGGTATAGSTSTLVDTSQSWIVDQFKGLYIHILDLSANVARKVEIAGNSDTVLFFRDNLAEAVAAGDRYTIAGIDWYADFQADYGNPMSLKRLFFLKTASYLEDGSSPGVLRVALEPDKVKRDWDPASTSEILETSMDADTVHTDNRVGGTGRSFRFRISAGLAKGFDGSIVFPAANVEIRVMELQLEGEEVAAR